MWGYRKWAGTGGDPANASKEKNSSISDWSKAFSTFISVYIQEPGREGDATQLLTYMAEIQSITEDGLDWFMYDDLYRRDKASTKKKTFMGYCQPNPQQ